MDTGGVLRQAGAALEARDARQRTPLHLASAMGQVDVMDALLAAGADIEARDDEGMSPRKLAGRRGRKAAVRFLRKAGAESPFPHVRLFSRLCKMARRKTSR